MAFNNRAGASLFPSKATTTSSTSSTSSTLVGSSSRPNSNHTSYRKETFRDLLSKIEGVSKEEFQQSLKPLIYEQLDKNQSYENSNLPSLVQHYLDTYSQRTFKILIGLDSPLDEYLFNTLLTKLNTDQNADNVQRVLMLLSNIVQTSPSWLPKFINSKSLKDFFAILKNEQDVVILGYAVLILVELVASLPSVISECLLEIFECFSRLAAFLYLSKPKQENAEQALFLQMNSIVYRLFLRLYGLYPCNFVEYLRNNYGVSGSNSNTKIFTNIIEPMMGKIRFHPSLIATSQADERKNTRWFYKETHDILAECAQYAIDPLESNFNSYCSIDADNDDPLGALYNDDDGENDEDSSSSNSFVSHHETFQISHRTDRPDVIFNQLNESAIHSKFSDLSPLSAQNLIPETDIFKSLESAQDALNLSNDSGSLNKPINKPTIVIPVETSSSSFLSAKNSRNIAISPFKPIDASKDFDFKDIRNDKICRKITKEHENDDEDEDLEVSQTMERNNLSSSSKNNLFLNVDHFELVGNIKKSFKKASSRIRYQSHCLPDPVSTNDPFCLDKQSELANLRILSQSCPIFCFEFLPSNNDNDNSSPKDGRRSQSETRKMNNSSVKDTENNDVLSKENKRINRKKACKSVDFTKEGQLKYRQIQKQLRQQKSIDLNRLTKAKDNSIQPQNQFTPHELLDKFMLLSSELFHNSTTSNIQESSGGNTNESGNNLSTDTVSDLNFLMRRGSNISGMSSNENIPNHEEMKKQQALLYAQLLFERHQRKQHAVRIRRVYRQNKELNEVQERLNESKAYNKNLKELIIELSKISQEDKKQFRNEKKAYEDKIDCLEKELENLKNEYQNIKNEKDINEKRYKDEIRDLNDTYRSTKIELDDYVTNHFNKNTDTAKLQTENHELKNQLILFGEFYNQMRESYNKSKTFCDNDKFIIDSLHNDNKELKHQLQDAKNQIDCLNSKCQKLQFELDDGLTILRTKSDNQEIAVLNDHLKMKDQQIDSLNSIIIHYDKYICNLKGQLALLERDNSFSAKDKSKNTKSDKSLDVPTSHSSFSKN